LCSLLSTELAEHVHSAGKPHLLLLLQVQLLLPAAQHQQQARQQQFQLRPIFQKHHATRRLQVVPLTEPDSEHQLVSHKQEIAAPAKLQAGHHTCHL
jgi:hypothetical protein